jgi:shikimate kinase
MDAPETRPTTRQHLYLIGMKHCGKTAVGRLLAELMDIPFIDFDELTARIHDPSGACSCREIYEIYGKRYFQRCEARAAALIAPAESEGPRVIALGGGTPENEEAMTLLSRMGKFMYIKEEPGIIYPRILAGGLPPFLRTEDPMTTFLALYETRDPVYARYAWRVIEPRGAEAREIALKALDILTREGGIARWEETASEPFSP